MLFIVGIVFRGGDQLELDAEEFVIGEGHRLFLDAGAGVLGICFDQSIQLCRVFEPEVIQRGVGDLAGLCQDDDTFAVVFGPSSGFDLVTIGVDLLFRRKRVESRGAGVVGDNARHQAFVAEQAQ